jgi:pyrroloquinoline quinone biosynthesis protein E
VRQRPALLYPEGAMFINDTGQAILELCDGSRTVAEIAHTLKERYGTEVLADVQEYLDSLARRDLIQWLESPSRRTAEPPNRPVEPPNRPTAEPSSPTAEPTARTAQPSNRPTTLLAELTYRCPLHCPYCSNPLEMSRAEAELSTADWQRVFTEARDLGVLQLGLSGGEPMVRKDLEELVGHARDAGLYTTLVTSALGLTRQRAERLRAAGIDHVQISFQDTDRDNADRIAGIKLGRQKYEAAALVKSMGLAFSVNVVLHRGNLDRIEEIITMAAELGADRVELANTQYYGWAHKNRRMLMPTRAQVEHARAVAEAAITRYRGTMQIVYVLPDYYEQYPKPCYGGWGNVYILVTPDGRALPCHGATQIGHLQFVNVREQPLSWIWERSPIFNAFRGDAWMREPCRSCPRKTQDFGGCRCQAFALTGAAENTDPVCSLSPRHDLIASALEETTAPLEYEYRYVEAGRS